MIKVFKLKDLIKYAITIIIPLIMIMITVKYIFNNINSKETQEVSGKAMTQVIDDSVDLLKISEIEEDDEESIKEWGKAIINSEFDIINRKLENGSTDEKKIEEQQNIEENESNQDTEASEVKQAKIDVITEAVPNSVNPKYTSDYNGVKINNSTEYELTEDILNPEAININKNKVLIYHTHTCESYTPTESFFYEATGNYRTTDLSYSVARVGDELENQLKSYGCQVIHDKTYHDYPAYNGSYARSLKTVQNILNENKDIDIVIDIHRDAIADSSYAPKVKIGDEYASQLMFVIGTDKANPEHTTWNQNLKFAVKIQQKANELYSGIFKPIILRNSTYNQNVAKAACIIEVGATGNTLEESINSMKYLAKIFEEI